MDEISTPGKEEIRTPFLTHRTVNHGLPHWSIGRKAGWCAAVLIFGVFGVADILMLVRCLPELTFGVVTLLVLHAVLTLLMMDCVLHQVIMTFDGVSRESHRWEADLHRPTPHCGYIVPASVFYFREDSEQECCLQGHFQSDCFVGLGGGGDDSTEQQQLLVIIHPNDCRLDQVCSETAWRSFSWYTCGYFSIIAVASLFSVKQVEFAVICAVIRLIFGVAVYGMLNPFLYNDLCKMHRSPFRALTFLFRSREMHKQDIIT